MSRFSEEDYKKWHRPASESEEARKKRAEKMIKDGLRDHPNLEHLNFKVFAQGSYGNNTNVRQESDIDICVMLRDVFYSEYPKGKTRDDYGFSAATLSYDQFRKWVIEAMVKKFGNDGIDVGNKSLDIPGNSYRLEADVVPALQYRNYSHDKNTDKENFDVGVKFTASDGQTVINYPLIHIENGKLKNNQTQRRYKRMVRIFKRVKIQMKDKGKSVPKGITSFLISGLIWNVPNHVFNDNETWEERMKAAIYFLWDKTQKKETCERWGEVSEKFYLFHPSRKWTVEDVNTFLKNMWNFLEFN